LNAAHCLIIAAAIRRHYVDTPMFIDNIIDIADDAERQLICASLFFFIYWRIIIDLR